MVINSAVSDLQIHNMVINTTLSELQIHNMVINTQYLIYRYTTWW